MAKNWKGKYNEYWGDGEVAPPEVVGKICRRDLTRSEFKAAVKAAKRAGIYYLHDTAKREILIATSSKGHTATLLRALDARAKLAGVDVTKKKVVQYGICRNEI